MRHLSILAFFLFNILVSAGYGQAAETFTTYYGTSDASAAVGVGKELFVSADDENNVLRVYKADQSSLPVSTFDLTPFLDVDSDYPEADIEGATIAGDLIYWISSHGRNQDGKMRQSRYRFFATSVKVEKGGVILTPVGSPCRTLINEMVKTATLQHLELGSATRFDAKKLKKEEREKLAPKEDGLNIEGLCATPDGKILYIGLRNPLFFDSVTCEKRAIIVPLLNPKQVIENGNLPIFGSPILWRLDGLGVRGMEYSRFHKAYFIIAGPADGASDFALYRWSGKEENQPVLVKKFPADKNNFTPETLVVFENSGRLLVLSDDGSLAINVANPSECAKDKLREDGKCLNKYLADQNKKHFRGLWLEQ